MAITKEELKRIYTIFEENGLYNEVSPYYGGLPVIVVSISWGDWKHNHLFTKYLMEENGYRYMGEEVTEEDGSDCYSADHFYIKKM